MRRGARSPVARTPSSEEMRCKMGADLEADNPQALILLPCGRFPGNPFPVACDGEVEPGGPTYRLGIDRTREQLKVSDGERCFPPAPISKPVMRSFCEMERMMVMQVIHMEMYL